MPKDEQCCDICKLVDKYTDYLKVVETDEELEFCVRQIVEKAYDLGYKSFLLEQIQENIAFLEHLEEENESEEQTKPNLKVVDNVKLN